MTESLRYERLQSQHASTLARMEKVYHPAMRQGEAVISERLRVLESTEVQMSWICHRGDECVGYIFAYPAYTQLEMPQPEFVNYVDDLQVKPGEIKVLFRLLRLFTDDIRSLDLDGLAIEGMCRENSYKLFRSHDKLMGKLGWRLEAERREWDPKISETMSWMRWKPNSQTESVFDRIEKAQKTESALDPALAKQLAELARVVSRQVSSHLVEIQTQLPIRVVRSRTELPGFGDFRGDRSTLE